MDIYTQCQLQSKINRLPKGKSLGAWSQLIPAAKKEYENFVKECSEKKAYNSSRYLPAVANEMNVKLDTDIAEVKELITKFLKDSLSEITGKMREAIKERTTAAPTTEQLNLLASLRMGGVSESEVVNLVDRFSGNYQAMKAFSKICKENKIEAPFALQDVATLNTDLDKMEETFTECIDHLGNVNRSYNDAAFWREGGFANPFKRWIAQLDSNAWTSLPVNAAGKAVKAGTIEANTKSYPGMLTVRQAADLMGVSFGEVMQLAKDGKIVEVDDKIRPEGWLGFCLDKKSVTGYMADREGENK